MKKTRAMLFRSKDKGHNWDYVSTVAVDPTVGTEGFGEPVIARVSHGNHAGRLLCFMRTGHELYEAMSDNDGVTWARPRPRVFADCDVYKTSERAEIFKNVKRQNSYPGSDAGERDSPRGFVDFNTLLDQFGQGMCLQY